jgi:hypothetical protein
MGFTPVTNYSKNKTSGLFEDGSDQQRAEYTYNLGSGWTPNGYDKDKTSVLLQNGGDEQRAVVTWNLGGEGGGGGGTSDYNDLDNKPAIDGVTLLSTTTKADLGLSRVYKYKGNVNTYADLANIQNPEEGDVWNVLENDKNYAWTGTVWDDIGGILPVDNAMSTSSENPVQNKVITNAINGKEDKLTITNSSSSTLSVTLANNTLYNNTNSALSTLTVTNPVSPTVDFLAQINFTSGATATTVTPNANIVYVGDNVNENVGFVPRSNCRYTVIYVYDGSRVRGIVQGVSL